MAQQPNTTAAQSNPIEVNDASGFDSAVTTLTSKGGVIRLKSGAYDSLTINGILPTQPIRIVAADPAAPPVIRKLTIAKSSNLTIQGLTFEPAGSEGPASYLINVDQGQRIQFLGNQFLARTDNPALRVRAARLTNVSDILVEDNRVVGLERAFVFAQGEKLKVSHNSFKGLTTDALNFFESSGVTVSQNLFLGFATDPGQHPDYIQFWTRRAKVPSKDILIEYNVMLQEGGTPVQGVFMDNDDKVPYENVTIRRNVMVQGSPHGITLELARNVSITENLLISSSISNYNVAIRALQIESGTVKGNAAAAVVVKDSPNVISTANTVLPKRNANFSRGVEERIQERFRSIGEGPIVGNLRILPEHLAAGPRKR